jgi:hypothetical protein
LLGRKETVTMLADLIIFALLIAFVCVATLGHILLGLALLTRRGERRTFAGTKSEPAAIAKSSNAAADCHSIPDKLAA